MANPIVRYRLSQQAYPPTLKEIHTAPKEIYTVGTLHPTMPTVAIVGSRKLTSYGRSVTYKIAYQLAKTGVMIVSGLALGIDSIAHKAALDAGGLTTAVLACGLDTIYPATNRQLAARIITQNGAIISEYDTGTPPLRQHFPARNRIISGLSSAVVVTEAAERSGALITAGFALDQNRLVMSVPGNITSPASVGCNNLLKAGAIPVTSAQDVLVGLGLEAMETAPNKPTSANKEESTVLDLLEQGINDADDLLTKTGWETTKLNQVLTLMEISGKLKNLGGGKWIPI